jgi:hypothetical protein
MGDVIQFLQEGVTVNIAFDVESAVILGVVVFLALTLALLVYGKVIS